MARTYVHINEDLSIGITIQDDLGNTLNPQTALRRVEVLLFHKQTGKEIAWYHTVDASDPIMAGWYEAEIDDTTVVVRLNGEDTKGLKPGELWIQIDIITDNSNFQDGEERHQYRTKLLDLIAANYV